MRKLIWFKLFFAFVTLPVWARCGFKTDYLTASTTAVTNATAPNTNIKLFIQNLPLNGGFGPQVNSTNLWSRTSISGGSYGDFQMIASTNEPSLTSGGSADPAQTYGSLLMNPTRIQFYLNNGNGNGLSTSNLLYMDSTGATFDVPVVITTVTISSAAITSATISSATVTNALAVKSLPAGRIPYLNTQNVFTSTADLRWETFFEPMLYANGMSLGYSGYAGLPGVNWWGTYSQPSAYLDDVCADDDAALCPRIVFDSGNITLSNRFGIDNSIRMVSGGDFGFFPTQVGRLKFFFGPSLTQFAQIYATPSNTGVGTEGGKVVTEVISASTTTAAFIIDGNTRITTSSFPIVAPYFTPSTASAYTNGQLLFGVTATGGLSISTMSGTTNQVTVTASTFNVTLSLPQSINTGATVQFGQMGVGTVGGTSQRIKIPAGSTTQCAINIAPGTLKTSNQAAGDIENNVDDLYYTIQTGTARKNVVLADTALTTGGHIPYTSTNGRLIDSSFLTYVGNRVALSAGSAGGAISLSAGGRPNPVTAGDIWVDTTTARLRAGLQSSTQTFAMIGSSETWTSTQTHKNDVDLIGTGKFTTNGAQIGLNISTYSDSGTFNFGTTTNTIAISNSSSTITLASSGTYRIDGMANMRYNGATFAANQFVTVNLYRQNNTPGVIANSQTQEELQISVGALTNQFGQFNLPPIFYTTTNTNDVISLQGSITATPGAGSFQATEASLAAQRLF